MSRHRLGAAAILAVLTVALTSCGGPEQPTTTLLPLPASTPTAEPTKPATKPKKKPKTITPVVPASLPRQVGTGPAGSMLATGNSSVALTFDDGPDPVYTPKMLEVLKKHRVTATFCVVGKRVRMYPGLVKRIVAEGHTICNHSWDHNIKLGKEDRKDILQDLTATNAAIHAAAPEAEIKYFRAPGGYFTTRLVEQARRLGMKSLYWSVDTRDWQFSKYPRGTQMVNHIVACIQTETRRGSIILAHDFQKPDTVTAMAKVLPWLKENVKLVALPT